VAAPDLPKLDFATLEAWEAWLAAQPEAAAGLWLKIAKQGSGKPSVTKREAIDGALCHGWIDGQLDRFDDDWFLIRFTPRKPRSKWSAVNRDRAEVLIAEGRMRPRGQAEIERAQADGRWAEAYPSQSRAEVPEDLKAALDAEPAAKALFETLDGTNRYAVLYRVHGTKSPATRAKKIAGFVSMLARGETLYPFKGMARRDNR
jgi:uncharacterized protein YdeI (YjbR/CyaY-like superfamily)